MPNVWLAPGDYFYYYEKGMQSGGNPIADCPEPLTPGLPSAGLTAFFNAIKKAQADCHWQCALALVKKVFIFVVYVPVLGIKKASRLPLAMHACEAVYES